MKVVTICGSMKFKNEMQQIAWDLEARNGYSVIQCVYNNRETKETDEEISNLVNAHWKKIDISDAIYVVNVGGYIGKSTANEIEYAIRNGKEVLYYEKVNEITIN